MGVPNKASQGGSATGYNPLTFYKPFLAEKVPLLYSLLTNGTPFTVKNFTSISTAVNALSLRYE